MEAKGRQFIGVLKFSTLLSTLPHRHLFTYGVQAFLSQNANVLSYLPLHRFCPCTEWLHTRSRASSTSETIPVPTLSLFTGSVFAVRARRCNDGVFSCRGLESHINLLVMVFRELSIPALRLPLEWYVRSCVLHFRSPIIF